MLFLLLFFYSTLFENLPEWDAATARFTPIGGGITNQNMLLTLKDKQYFVRFGGKTRDLLLATHQAELEGLRLGLSPELIEDDPETGLLILEYIASEPISLKNQEMLKKCAELLQTLHSLPPLLSRTLFPQEIIQFYLGHVDEKSRAERVLSALPPLTPEKAVPCHLDLHKQNMLKKEDRLYFIDWEYSALSDPLFDLAVFSSNERFSDEEMKQLLSYYNNSYSKTEWERLYTFRALADLRWALWGEIRKNQKLSERFFKEAEKRSVHR